MAVRSCLRRGLVDKDVEELLVEPGIAVDHVSARGIVIPRHLIRGTNHGRVLLPAVNATASGDQPPELRYRAEWAQIDLDALRQVNQVTADGPLSSYSGQLILSPADPPRRHDAGHQQQRAGPGQP